MSERQTAGRRNFDRPWVRSTHLLLFFTLGFFVGREFYDIDFIDATTGAIDYVIYTIKGIGGVTAVVALVNLIFAIKQRRKR